METYMDAALSPQQRADALLAQMSVAEKMGQTVCYFYIPTTPQVQAYLREQHPGEGIEDMLARQYPCGAGQVSCLEMRQLESVEEAAQAQRELQQRLMDLSEHRIPAIFHMEGLCGAYLQGAASFPSGIGRASSWNPALEREIGRIVGRQERAVGISQTLAPVLDISRDSRMGRQGETYGEDPALAAALGTAFVQGLQGGDGDGLRSQCVAKHFLGFHAGQGGIHGADCEIGPRLLREVYAKPFQAAITEGGLRGIMPSYNSLNGEPVSASKELLTGLLRGEMGFDGITVSDYCAIMNIHTVQKVCASLADAGLRAMDAGMDMELQVKKCFDAELQAIFESGQADIRILDTAVRRILTAKFRMGLFEHPFAQPVERLAQVFFSKDDDAICLQSARESMVLLKNDGVLPLPESAGKIAVIGWHANTARALFGGYTHFSMAEGMLAAISTMAGLQSDKEAAKPLETWPGTPIQKDDDPAFEAVMKRQKPNAKSLLQELRGRLPQAEVVYARGYPVAGNDTSGHAQALEAAKNADVVLMTLGGKHGTSSIASMGEGIDATDIGLPYCQESLIEKLAGLNIPLVGVHFNGRPVSSDVADRHLNAILEAWNPAEKGAQAIVDALLGAYNPAGRLPVSVACTAGQIPVYYNHPNGSSYHQGESIGFAEYVDLPHTPRYYFGQGLSYTSFAYSGLMLDKKQVPPDGVLKLSVDVENTGGCAGEEVVQLYLRDVAACMTRPVMELAGFARVYLAPGERKTVTFEIPMSQTAFLDREMRWLVEQGEMEVLVGASSYDIRLRDGFTITSSAHIDGKKRAFCSQGECV